MKVGEQGVLLLAVKVDPAALLVVAIVVVIPSSAAMGPAPMRAVVAQLPLERRIPCQVNLALGSLADQGNLQAQINPIQGQTAEPTHKLQ